MSLRRCDCHTRFIQRFSRDSELFKYFTALHQAAMHLVFLTYVFAHRSDQLTDLVRLFHVSVALHDRNDRRALLDAAFQLVFKLLSCDFSCL